MSSIRRLLSERTHVAAPIGRCGSLQGFEMRQGPFGTDRDVVVAQAGYSYSTPVAVWQANPTVHRRTGTLGCRQLNG